MTEALYHADSYLREFNATVVGVMDNGIMLDRTAFYPEGGGQPNDIGVLEAGDREYNVTKVSRKDGEILHTINGPLPVAGAAITGVIDWERRYALMRTHTALHILCGVIWRTYGSQVTGCNMQPLQARMDFEMEHMSADFAEEMERLANDEIAEARDISAQVLPRADAFAIPDLIRTKINLLPEGIAEVRVLDIKGLDIQADGGTHVANTREVGLIKVVGHESKGRINKRLRITVEPAAT
jgi:misacylated tRNA(Ala) deacylase